ncbi:hypothetical protein [Clostridium botulinum]|uniref:Cell surface protein n=1 Tax=Clostridium botulinum TaxID=1491 RepID=A0ABD7CMG6_CLOBO|nr:hypothetical protein [Clostridium botulinum]MCC5425896.1 hypothetical protein [Clostridium botulinum]QRI54358.1 hypothetical protein JQS73_04390 [Clostridium botulinum]
MKIKKKLILLMMLCIMAMASSITVHAGNAYSDWKDLCKLSGITYKGQSFVYADTGTAIGSALTSSSTPVATGRLGAAARLYKSNGALVESTSATYSQGSGAFHRATTSMYYGKGSYYAKGTSYVYNGSGYNSYALYSSPIQSAGFVGGKVFVEEKVNEYGETYGSEYFLNMRGIEPDLILAVGKNGQEGYVRSEDLNKKAETLNEAINYDSSAHEIPVYKEDGITTIDSFIIEEPITK